MVKALSAVAVLIVAAFVQVACNDKDIVSQYKCGSHCDESQMGSDDPTADAMPHTFGPHIPLSPSGLSNTMNAYLKNDMAHQEDSLMVPHPRAAMPDVAVIADKAPNCAEAETAVVPVVPRTVPINSRIPYESPNDKPALRRPCNLDQVMELLKTIKQSLQSEDEHDAQLHAAIADGTSPLAIAQRNSEEAEQRVQNLDKARRANETLTNVLVEIGIKASLLEETMNEKALLIKEEGMLKAPIVKAIGRTNINLQSAIGAKQAALTDFAQHPAFTKDEMAQILATYDELIISVKKQLAGLHKEASDVLTPIQLKINQTDNAIARIKSEIENLRSQQTQLIPLAEQYTPAGLEGARLIASDALAHFNAEKLAQSIDVSSFDQRAEDRSSIVHVVDEMLTVLSDVQQPQDPSEVYVEVREPVSLAGSVPMKPIN